MRRIARMTVILGFASVMALAGAGIAAAQDSSDIALDSPIRSLELGQGEVRADLDVDLKNTSDTRRLVSFELIDLPAGWDIGIWNRFWDFKISQLVVEPAEDTPGQRPRLRVDVPDDVLPGDYSFTLLVTSPGAEIEYDRATFTITVPSQVVEEDDSEVSVTTDFPILRGPSNSQYEFEIVIKNDTGEDASFTLAAQAFDDGQEPQQGWELGFTPAFGEAKLISSLSIADSLTERVAVQVTPPRFAAAGDYLIPVAIESDAYSTVVILQLTIVGRGELAITTKTGRFSIDATAGEESTTAIQLDNFGSGGLANIALDAVSPNDWTVTFQIDNVESLPAANFIPIDVSITPPGDAIPGDYILELRGRSADATDSIELRVTVEQSTIWGWLGIVLVLLVFGGLGGLFVRLGRR
jgi:uncharacterized membrane protein